MGTERERERERGDTGGEGERVGGDAGRRQDKDAEMEKVDEQYVDRYRGMRDTSMTAVGQ